MSLLGASRSISLRVDGQDYMIWTQASITRDLSEISHSFSLQCDDVARAMAALPPKARPVMAPQMLRWGQSCEILIDGESTLVGWIVDVMPVISGRQIGVSISGYDKTGDLVDCAAAPNGPMEWHGLKIEDYARKLCKPFGISVAVEADTGEPLKKISIDTGETVMSAIEKVTRKRGLLVVSDGVGGIILTRSGTTRAPADLKLGQSITEGRGQFSSRNRFSDVYVKGQIGGAAGQRKSAPLDVTAAPFSAVPAQDTGPSGPDAPSGKESRALAIQGHAQDKDVKRWRPTVKQVRSASLLKDAQAQAEWYVANARGASETVTYSYAGFRANGTLWRLNTLSHVSDPYQDIDKDLLIAGIVMNYGPQGSVTELRLTGKEAYDIMAESDDAAGSGSNASSGSGGKTTGTDLDTRAEPLS